MVLEEGLQLNMHQGAHVGVLGSPARDVPLAAHHYVTSSKLCPGSELAVKRF